MIYEVSTVNQARGVMAEAWPKIREQLENGQRLRIEIRKLNRTLAQNAKFHAMIGRIATQMREVGSTWNQDDWKRLLVDQWAHETDRKVGRVCPSLDGERVVQLGAQTRSFTVEMCNEFIEWLYAWAAEREIDVGEPLESALANFDETSGSL